MNRRTRTLVVVGVAVVFAALASFGVYRAIQRIPVREVEVVRLQTVVAAEPVPVGVLLAETQVKLVPWPADSPVPGGYEDPAEVIGRGVTVALVENEPITEAKLAPRDSGGGLPPLIPEGMRAMSVPVNDIVGVAGFATPGTRVDVIVTFVNAERQMSRIVLNNILVLASGRLIDQERARQGEAIPTSVATLLVTTIDAERLALAQQTGSVTLALRNPLDIEQVDTEGARMASLLSPTPEPVQRVVQGRPRVVTPPPPPRPAPYTVETIKGTTRSEVELQRAAPEN